MTKKSCMGVRGRVLDVSIGVAGSSLEEPAGQDGITLSHITTKQTWDFVTKLAHT